MMSFIFFFLIVIIGFRLISTQEIDSELMQQDEADFEFDNSTKVGNFTDFQNETATTESEFERVFQEAIHVDLPGSNCTPSYIEEFPPDIFTPKQRLQGGVIFHSFICIYIFYAFAIVCGDYFVPSVELLSKQHNMESDIARATVMGIATSSPELFTSIVSTFIMRGDIGLATIVGSAVFNHLAVCACIGFACTEAVIMDWWPLTRDVTFYAISVVSLFFILLDKKIFWYESFALLLLYGLFVLGMYYDPQLHAFAERFVYRESPFSFSGRRRKYRVQRKSTLANISCNSASSTTIVTISNGRAFTIGETKAQLKPTTMPNTTRLLTWVEWGVGWPARAVLSITIPDCRKGHMSRFYAFTFIMSTVWMAVLAYIAAWMATIVAHTVRVPVTVFGISVIAAGTSVPEIVSSVIMAKAGYGMMAVTNAVGSNTFNILVCLGVPWLIEALINRNLRNNFAEIGSMGLEYSTGMTLLSLGTMHLILVWNRFRIDKKLAIAAFALYMCFLIFGILVEMNFIFSVNLPIC